MSNKSPKVTFFSFLSLKS